MAPVKLQLYVFKRYEMERLDSRRRIFFVVVNVDKAEEYPGNFVCVLPTQKNSIVHPVTEFSRLFGKDSLSLAKKLLTRALEDEDDSEIRAEIGRRLRLIQSCRENPKDLIDPGRHLLLNTLQVSSDKK